MGPPPAEGMLRELMAMGADKAFWSPPVSSAVPIPTLPPRSWPLPSNKIGVDKDDIVLCGRQAIDGDTAQVGPQIAEKLHLPQVTYAADITKDGDTLTVKRMLEDGYMTIKVQTPCLLTCIKELNTPRYMSVGGVVRLLRQAPGHRAMTTLKDDPLIDATTIGLKGSPTNIFKTFTPPQKGAGMMLEGD